MLRPIDVQQVIMQVERAGKVQQVEQNHPEMQQRYFELQLREEKKRLHESVRKAEETREKRIDENQEREKRRDTGGNQDAKEGDLHGGGEQEMPKQGGNINIKV